MLIGSDTRYIGITVRPHREANLTLASVTLRTLNRHAQ